MKKLLRPSTIYPVNAMGSLLRTSLKNVLFFVILLFVAQDAVAQNGPQLRRIEGQGNDGLVLDFVAGMHDSILNSPGNVYPYPLYDNNAGPVAVDIYNPALTPPGEYMIVFNDVSTDLPGNDLTDYSTKWMLINVALNDTVFGDSVIAVDHTQDIAAWGMTVRTKPTDDPGTAVYTANGFLEATMNYANPALPWLTGLSDVDSAGPQNWIRSGTSSDVAAPFDNDYGSLDVNEDYEGVLNGTWSPYRMCSSTGVSGTGAYVYPGAPAWDQYQNLVQMKNLASIDVVITADQSKWTRCPVLEIQEDPLLALGGAEKLDLRKSLSVDKNGKKAGDPGYNSTDGGYIDSAGILIPAPTGMGWFPGYAVNLETGERLNMAFGEDSWYPGDNGSDMVWNPTSTVMSGANPVYGGKHYIYVFGHNGDGTYPGTDLVSPNRLRDVPVYDKGLTVRNLLRASETAGSVAYKREVYTDAMWVNIPLLNPGYSLLATDVNVRLRVSKQYRQQNIDGTNNTNPKYIFDAGSITGIATLQEDQRILVYPNPAADQLFIAYNAKQQNASLEIYNVQGQLQKRLILDGDKVSVNIAALPAGLYMVKISDNGQVISKKFLKR